MKTTVRIQRKTGTIKQYTWSWIIKRPGVYQPIQPDDTTAKDTRIVVLGGAFPAVLFAAGKFFEAAVTDSWDCSKFIPTNEDITVTFTPAASK